MKKHRMRGVFDPITAAFLLAIVGTVAAISLDRNNTAESVGPQTGRDTSATAALNQLNTGQ